jgi:hypothetical protein
MTDEAVPGSQPEGEALPEGNEAPAGESPAKPEASETDADRNWRQVREQIGKLEQSEAALKRERDAERFEREKLSRELELLRTRNAPEGEPSGDEKTLDDFFGDVGAFTAYLKQEIRRESSNAGKAAAEQEKSARNWTQFQERAAAYAKESPGYNEAFQRLQGFFPPRTADAIVAVEEAPALIEFLGNNVTEAISLRNADPFTAGMLIGQLQARIKAERSKAAAAKKDPPPPPAPKLEGGPGSGSSVKPDSIDSDSLSDAEWARRRNAQEAARRRRQG